MARGKYERAPEPRHRSTGRHQAETTSRKRREETISCDQEPDAEQYTQPERPAYRAAAVSAPEQPQQAAPVQEEEPAEKRTVFTVIRDILVGLVVVFAIGMMVFTVISVTTLNQNERSFLGYRAFIVLSDSMKATDFDAGDVVLVKPVDPATLQPGDIIAFTSRNSVSYGQTVTHKIRALTTDENGEPAFVTYGTTTDTDDETTVSYDAVLGKYCKRLPKVGYFFQFLRTGPGYILFILVPFGLVILYHGIRSVRLFQQEKKEQRDAMEAERAQMAAEREETRRLLEELKQMQAQSHQTET